MAFVASFGLELAFTAISMLPSFLQAPDGPDTSVILGVGSNARGYDGLDTSGGIYPNMVLYNTHGDSIATSKGSIGLIDPASNIQGKFDGDTTQTPEYLRINAATSDAICVSYVAITSATGDKRTWHAGYVKQCAPELWYPSPEIIPGTDFRPGCVQLSKDDRFIDGITLKLTDFGFPDSTKATTAQKQYTDFPNTLCQAPGRMTLWDSIDDKMDCIPFYDFDEQKNATTGYDLDFQKIVDGHKIPCDIGSSKTHKQTIEPGKGPKTLTPQQILDEQAAQQAKNEAGTNENAPPPGAGSFGGTVGTIDLNEAGQNPDGAAAGAGSFGGVVSSIPKDQLSSADFTISTTKPTATSSKSTRVKHTLNIDATSVAKVNSTRTTSSISVANPTLVSNSSKIANSTSNQQPSSLLKVLRPLPTNGSNIASNSTTPASSTGTTSGPAEVSMFNNIQQVRTQKKRRGMFGLRN